MASLSFFVPPPASEVEWKPIDVIVRLTYQFPDAFSEGTFYLNLKYGTTTVFTESRFVNGISPGPFPSNLDEIFTIGTRFFYSGAEVEAVFVPNSGITEYVTQSLDITPAFREFTGQPFTRTPHPITSCRGCRWHEESVTVTMKESSTGPAIATYGQKIEDGTYVNYGLTSSDGFEFKDSVGGTSITNIQFSGGSATFALGMNNEVTDGIFTLTDQEPGWSSDTYDSDPISVMNPDFTWQNMYDASNESIAYDAITNGRIDADNPFVSGTPPNNFPDPNWTVSADPSTAATAIHGDFASGILNNINVTYQAVTASSAHFKLEYSPDPAFEADSEDFDNVSPIFVFSGGPFDRNIPRFFNGETNTFHITAQNKAEIPVTNLPADDWEVTGFSAPIPTTFTVGTGVSADINTSFPTGAVTDYTFTVYRTTETSLTGTSDAIPMVAQVSIDPLLPSGSTITVTGNATSDTLGLNNINVTVEITGPSSYSDSDTVATVSATGAYSATFGGLTAGGTYTVTVRETDDPGTSSQNTGTFDIAVATPPEINITLIDDPSGVDQTDYDLDSLLASDEPPLAIHANRGLTVEIITTNPGTSGPSATLTKPDGSNVSLTFTGLASTINQAIMNINGVYIIRVDDYTDGASQTVQGISRRFVISYNAINQTQMIEGWGYYPREEGTCSNCAEEANPSITVPAWTETGAATVTTALGDLLAITSAGAVSTKNFTRTYNYIFENDGKPDNQVGTSYAYFEAGVKINIISSGDTLSGFDQANNDFGFKSTGAGLLLNNGYYKFLLTFIDVQSGTTVYTGKRAAVKIFDPDNEKYFISTSTIDWETDFIIVKVTKTEITGDQFFEVSYKPMNSTGAFTSILSVPAYRLLGDINTGPDYDTAKVGFGVFEDNNQNITSEWEFVRYAFYDAGFELIAGETYKIGFENTQRSGETDFYRSPKVLINASTTDQPAPGTNQISSIIYREIPTRFDAFNIPIKIRYSIADWDDSAEDSTDGFFKPGFINYYENTGEFSAVNTTLSACAEELPLAGITSGDTAWDFTHDATRLARRMFIIGIVDAPLLPCPTVIKSITTTDYLIDDSPAKTDLRCAVREFLPDYYIRDHATDDGSAPAGGSTSPDITLGIFLGDGSTYDPHDVPTSGGQDPDDARYPAGFARDETPVDGPGGAYQVYNDQKDAGGIKVYRNAWSDFDSSNAYFNRVWLRISNRGIVPGPAEIQTFYGDSQTRSDFVPSLARDEAWEQIIGQATLVSDEKYIQNRFMTFDPPDGSNHYNLNAVSAIPALSGYSTPGVDKSYTLVEFKWRITSTDFPPSDKRHGCLTAFINQPPSFTTGIDTARRWDAGPLEGTPDTADPNVSIWPITQQANNVTVKNTNIVFGEDPGTSDDYNPNLKTVIGPDDNPVNFRKSPVEYKLTFAKQNAKWGLRVDGKQFKNGELIIKISRFIANNVKLRNFKEITEYEKDKRIYHLALADRITTAEINLTNIKPEEAAKINNLLIKNKPFRFFVLQKGSVGEIQNLNPLIIAKRNDVFEKYNYFNLYFKPDVGIKKGIYNVKVEELVNGKVTGGFETAISIIERKMIKYVGDERKMVAYEAKDNLFKEKVIPYQYRVPFIGAGHVNYDYFVLNPGDRIKLKTPEAENEFATIDKAIMTQKETRNIIDKLDIPYSVSGKILDSSKKPVENLIVRLYDKDIKEDDFLGVCRTDKDGFYCINFTEKDFRDGFSKDTKPDIYIKVLDKMGTELNKTKTKCNADMQTIEDIILKEKIDIYKSNFKIDGKIINDKNLSAIGLLIRAFDEDKKSADDFLGESITDNNGDFEILFDESSFKDKNNKESEENLPDIYLNIYKQEKGKFKLLGRTKTKYNTNAESYLIKIKL